MTGEKIENSAQLGLGVKMSKRIASAWNRFDSALVLVQLQYNEVGVQLHQNDYLCIVQISGVCSTVMTQA